MTTSGVPSLLLPFLTSLFWPECRIACRYFYRSSLIVITPAIDRERHFIAHHQEEISSCFRMNKFEKLGRTFNGKFSKQSPLLNSSHSEAKKLDSFALVCACNCWNFCVLFRALLLQSNLVPDSASKNIQIRKWKMFPSFKIDASQPMNHFVLQILNTQ